MITNENFELKSISEPFNSKPYVKQVFKLGTFVNKIINELNSVN